MGTYNGFLNQNDKSVDPSWYSFVAFGKLYELGNSVDVTCDGTHIYASAARNKDKAAVLISTIKVLMKTLNLI